MICEDLESLERFANGELHGDSRSSLQSHVSRCVRCRSTLEEIAANLSLVGEFRSLSDDAPKPQVDQSMPELMGRFRIHGELGRGGMGIVYLAEDQTLRRKVALKTLPNPDSVGSRKSLEQFEREARILASIHHPNIATIYSLEQFRDIHFFAMEWVAGQTLTQRLADGPLTIAEAIAICRQVAVALEAAHERGIVHLDVKPHNVALDEESHVKLLDFGLARAVHASGVSQPTESTDRENPAEIAVDHTARGGTPGYMSPEQIRGLSADHKADVWAFGCVLYHCLAGSPPFQGSTASERVRATLESAPDWASLPPETPASVRNLIERCLTRDLDERIGSLAEARRDLEEELSRITGRQQRPQSVPVTTGHPSNLPHRLSNFIGRHREITELERLLSPAEGTGTDLARSASGSSRLVTISGTAGCGKTRLALEVAVRLPFPDGSWLVDLLPLRFDEEVAPALARVLQVDPNARESTVESLAEQLEQRQMLLVLDNCEHLLHECAGLCETLLSRSKGLHILATSREALGVEGESVFTLAPLSIPSAVRDRGSEPTESEQLFFERVATSGQPMEARTGEAEEVAEICRRLDGIPLAIELAAARARALPLDEIIHRLDDRFRLLTGGPARSLEHHQTLRASIDWSYEALEEREQRLFARLSVFSGGWTVRAAEAIGVDEATPSWEILDLLANLVGKSLISLGETGRYGMLDTLHEYARDRLTERGDRREAEAKHRDYYVSVAEEAKPHLFEEDQADWFARLNLENSNLRTALERFLVDRPDLAARLAWALERYWFVSGHWDEGWKLGSRILAHPALDLNSKEQADVAAVTATLAGSLGRLEDAQNLLESSLATSVRLGDKRAQAEALLRLGRLACTREAAEDAIDCFSQCLTIQRELGNAWGIAATLNNLGVLVGHSGELEEARTLMGESLELRRQVGDPRGIAISLNNLGLFASREGRIDESRAYYEESLAIHRELGDPNGVAIALYNLGNLSLASSNCEGARTYLRESLALHEELGDLEYIARTHECLGKVDHSLGDHAGARRHFLTSARAYSDLDIAAGTGRCLLGLGIAVGVEGDLPVAVRILGFAEAWAERFELDLDASASGDAGPTWDLASEELGPVEVNEAAAAGRRSGLEETLALAAVTAAARD